MTHPISQYGRLVQADPSSRTGAAKSDARASASREGMATSLMSTGSDEVRLSEVAREAMKEPEFDRAKVEAIKQAIQQGQYPLDVRRIAENFVAIEKMIKG
jgi:negative regulator of flagellin synthesis FlgM